MKHFNNCLVIWLIGTFCIPFLCIEARTASSETCALQGEIIEVAVKTCIRELPGIKYLKIVFDFWSTTLTVDELKTFSAANCAKIDETTECIIEQKNALAYKTCKSDISYGFSIYVVNSVIVKNLLICGKQNGTNLLEAMIPQDGLKCFNGNDKYKNCLLNTETPNKWNSDSRDMCADIDALMNCLHTANDCLNPNAVESYQKLLVLYKEKVGC